MGPSCRHASHLSSPTCVQGAGSARERRECSTHGLVSQAADGSSPIMASGGPRPPGAGLETPTRTAIPEVISFSIVRGPPELSQTYTLKTRFHPRQDDRETLCSDPCQGTAPIPPGDRLQSGGRHPATSRCGRPDGCCSRPGAEEATTQLKENDARARKEDSVE